MSTKTSLEFNLEIYVRPKIKFVDLLEMLIKDLTSKELEFLILICDQRKKNEFLIKFDYKKTLKSRQLCNRYLRILESKEFIFYEDGLIGINLHKFPYISSFEINNILAKSK